MVAAVPVTDWLVLELLIAPAWVAVIVGLLAAAVILIAWRRPVRTGPWGRRVLVVLRLAVVAAVGCLLLQPVVLWQGRTKVRTAVAIFLDSSRSMAVADAAAPGGGPRSVVAANDKDATERVPPTPRITRAEAVRQAFLSAGKAYDELSARCILQPVAFGSSVRPMGSFAPDSKDPRTDITETLAWALDETAREDSPAGRTMPFRSRLGAVVIISDGAANRARGSAEDAARQLEARGIKVHTVLVGADVPAGAIRDVSVRDIRVPARVFYGYRPQVRAVITVLGLKGQQVSYSLTVNDEPVQRSALCPTSDNETQEVVLDARMTQRGLVRLAVVAEPVPGELVASNNRAEAAVRVEEGAIRVLYLEGGVRPEGKYLARALGESAEINLDRRILVGRLAATTGGPRSVVAANDGDATERVPPKPYEVGGVTPADIEKFDLVVLGDLGASSLDPAVTACIAERVAGGRLNLLVLGGLNSFGAGGWADTPLVTILPVAIRAGEGQVPGPLALRSAPGAAGHFIFAGEGATPMNFDALPPLGGASAVGPLDPSARLLAQSADGRPLLAVRQFGTGRVAAFMADTTYQWVLAPAETRGADVHRRFWRQLALWAAGRDGRPQTDFWVTTDRPHYVLTDPDSAPVAEVTVHSAGPATLELKGPDGQSSPVALDRTEDTDRRALLTLSTPGRYTLTATGDARLDRTEFLVSEQDFESARVLADAAAMERLARAGGGTFRRLSDLPVFMADLARTLEPQFEPTERRLPLGAGRVFLAAVILLLTVEWILRRKWAL